MRTATRSSLSRVGGDPQIRRLLALARSIQERVDDALAVLADDTDPENQMLRAELQASKGDFSGALTGALSVDPEALPDHVKRFRWQLAGDMSIQLKDDAHLAAAVAGLRALDPQDVIASVLEIRRERKNAEDDGAFHLRLQVLAAACSA